MTAMSFRDGLEDLEWLASPGAESMDDAARLTAIIKEVNRLLPTYPYFKYTKVAQPQPRRHKMGDGIRVKPLYWRAAFGSSFNISESPVGIYRVFELDGMWRAESEDKYFGLYRNEEAAKAACQKSYESTIKLCLE